MISPETIKEVFQAVDPRYTRYFQVENPYNALPHSILLESVFQRLQSADKTKIPALLPDLSAGLLSSWSSQAIAFTEVNLQDSAIIDGNLWMTDGDGDYVRVEVADYEGPIDVKEFKIMRKNRQEESEITITFDQDGMLENVMHPVTIKSETKDRDGDLVKEYEVTFLNGLISKFSVVEYIAFNSQGNSFTKRTQFEFHN